MHFLKTSLPDVWTLDSGKPGPHVAIMGGVHGNEPCGVHGVHWALDHLTPPLQGRVTVILGNRAAVEAQKRFLDYDLNRLYNNDVLHLSQGREAARVEEIKQALTNVDYLLDIHSTTTPTIPLTCSSDSSKHLALCSVLPVGFMTTGWGGKILGLAGEEYLDSQGGVGITIECGSHLESSVNKVAEQAIIRFLQATGMLPGTPLAEEKPHIIATETVYAQTDSFQFLGDTHNFRHVPAGEIYAVDGETDLAANYDAYFIFPVPHLRKGEEAVTMGKKFLS